MACFLADVGGLAPRRVPYEHPMVRRNNFILGSAHGAVKKILVQRTRRLRRQRNNLPWAGQNVIK
jgi:hypothetical protein